MTTKPKAHIYIRVSTDYQDHVRQEKLIEETQAKGYLVADIYREKESGTTINRPELQRMLSNLKAEDIIVAEHLDRITRLPLEQAEALMAAIAEKGAKVTVPNLIELPTAGEGLSRIVLDAMQSMLLKIALYQCREDWETRKRRQAEGIALAKAKGVYRGRKPDEVRNAKIVELRSIGYTINKIAQTLNASESQVKLVLKKKQYRDISRSL
jgi:DNA invertase Pin-like site-specific DNA recombinase